MSDPNTDPPPPPANPPPVYPAAPFPIPPFVPGPPPASVPEPPPPPVVITRYFSPSTLGFYSSEVSYVPPDAVVITDALWQQLLADNAAGMTIAWDAGANLPIAVAPVTTLYDVQQMYLTLMRESDWTQLTDTPVAITNAFITYRDELRTIITNLPPDLSTIVWPIAPTIANPAYNRSF